MKNRSRRNAFASALDLGCLVAASIVAAGCCNDVTTSTCFDWKSTECPATEVAASKLDVAEHQVTSPGTFWPAHDYEVDGQQIHVSSSCCYDVVTTVCTEELH